jgi:hypothetical protein
LLPARGRLHGVQETSSVKNKMTVSVDQEPLQATRSSVRPHFAGGFPTQLARDFQSGHLENKPQIVQVDFGHSSGLEPQTQFHAARVKHRHAVVSFSDIA